METTRLKQTATEGSLRPSVKLEKSCRRRRKEKGRFYKCMKALNLEIITSTPINPFSYAVLPFFSTV